MFFQRHLPLFLDYLSAEKGLAANTLEAYRRDLEGFGNFLASSRTDASRLTRGDIVAFLGVRRADGMSPRTLARVTSALRGLYGFHDVEVSWFRHAYRAALRRGYGDGGSASAVHIVG